jgi:hypothetical protein
LGREKQVLLEKAKSLKIGLNHIPERGASKIPATAQKGITFFELNHLRA